MNKKLGGTIALLAIGLLSQAQKVTVAKVLEDAKKQTFVMMTNVKKKGKNIIQDHTFVQ